ncbi:hypothetical protein EDB13_101829 [Vibrio crassostreae]|uniref:hypothetical protein n=1 Tax=Vibrio crassostreae TaxID=246167 RepID=UPI00104ED338|nr:hypothetical protein [Vibrio crassostreae]TCV18005.1 hypothetical protein EDB13_101829 [Vibrio crassostreae]
MELIDLNLRSFLKANPSLNIGEIIVECRASSLLKTTCETERENWSKLIRDNVLESRPPVSEYRVVYIPFKSYILYFRGLNEVTIWVAYTEPKYQKQGFISLLLAELKKNNNVVNLNTTNSSLERLASKLGVNIV